MLWRSARAHHSRLEIVVRMGEGTEKLMSFGGSSRTYTVPFAEARDAGSGSQ
jgi:hypothetical protein